MYACVHVRVRIYMSDPKEDGRRRERRGGGVALNFLADEPGDYL